MCGICGIYGERNEAAIVDMLEAVKSRGPDSSSIHLTENHSFASARLAIINTGADILHGSGTEPITLFNGEIYNYKTLQKDFGLGNAGDLNEVEVAGLLLQKYGPKAAEHFKGMFALAYYDGKRLMLIRDRFGIKPLFYCQIGTRLVFASEIKALLRHPDVPAVIDEGALEELAVFGFFLAPDRTLLSAIKQVPPGAAVIFANGALRIERFSELPRAEYMQKETISYGNAVDLVEAALDTAVSVMMRHDDHPKAIYLSGGVDSSLLSLFASKHTGKNLLTFTLADSNESADLLAAKAVARALGTEHHEYLVRPEELLNELPAYVFHYENVVAGGVFDIYGGLAFHLLSRRIAEHTKVAFSGEGADELFGGYYWIYTHPLGFSDRIRLRHQAIGGNGHLGPSIAKLFPMPEDENKYRKSLFDLLIRGGLSNYHLWSVDRSAGAFGFEIRPAYLFDDLAQIALRLPIDYKANKRRTKLILKDILRRRGEQLGISHLADREKLGMPAAVANAASAIDEYAQAFVPMGAHLRPYAKYFANPIEAMMFDLFYYTFVVHRGRPPELKIEEFYKEGLNARMYA